MPLQIRPPATALMAGLCLALAGCTSLAPAYQSPEALMPDRYGDQANDASSPVLEGDWRSFFTDPAQQALIERALANNHDLRLAVLRVGQAQAAYGIQRADGLPTLGAGFDATRARVPGDLNLTGRPLLGNQIQLGVGFNSWELDFWGRVRSLNEAALQSYLATDAAREAVRLSVIVQTANSDLALRELDERLALARRTSASREESLRIFKRREALGATSKLELTQVELLAQQASALVDQLAQAREMQAHALALLVGGGGGGGEVAPALSTARLDDLAAFAEIQPGLPSALLVRRPDIVAAEHGLRAAHANIGAAKANFFPRIALTGSWGTASAELEGLFKTGSNAWSLAPSVALPLFDSGRRQSALDLAELRRDEALVRYEQTVQAAFRDVSDALSARHWLAVQVTTLRATQSFQRERARLAKLRYDSGAVRYLEVLDAERELMSVEQQLVQARRAQLSAQASLYAALGGALPAPRPESSTAGPAPSPAASPLVKN
ncbi:efflux transporter outer membrane subunit [Roseateles koreensis]|uniref:Efflux transporter outer membrane subunit n=1 Tax=Roseateles koreensis TaxID=2987526 RepID=A0ABT5KMX9_9BURK|nr:efflux transporter outer membrane subunit [Roseateles koreensis]MDC8784264.1 efflux transporter outer membrane subunit [Roseateles koreensis]